jgi:hypothetical protein
MKQDQKTDSQILRLSENNIKEDSRYTFIGVHSFCTFLHRTVSRQQMRVSCSSGLIAATVIDFLTLQWTTRQNCGDEFIFAFLLDNATVKVKRTQENQALSFLLQEYISGHVAHTVLFFYKTLRYSHSPTEPIAHSDVIRLIPFSGSRRFPST